MTDKAVKVGDVVLWMDVPSEAMVKESDGFYTVRSQDYYGCYVKRGNGAAWGWICQAWEWEVENPNENKVVIIALGLTGNETADELRALAEAFERDHPAA